MESCISIIMYAKSCYYSYVDVDVNCSPLHTFCIILIIITIIRSLENDMIFYFHILFCIRTVKFGPFRYFDNNLDTEI